MKTEIPDLTGYAAKNFLWRVDNRVGYLTLNRPDRKNPLTFESYAELRDLFRLLHDGGGVRVVVVDGAGGNFCSGGDVHEIIGPLTKLEKAARLHAHDRRPDPRDARLPSRSSRRWTASARARAR
jgi:enoyl-CoA hydratase/carnithine racemase